MPELKNGSEMTCEEFQQQLPELFESGIDLDTHPHLQNCDNCAALVRDLKYIAQQAKLLLPIQDPSPAVWKKIRTALEHEPGKKEDSSARRC